MLPTEWGPIVWYNFHMLSYTYNENEKERYILFFKSMPYILPCLVCTDHFKDELARSPPNKNIKEKNDMIKWLNTMHNSVNKRLGKMIINLKEAHMIYHNNNGSLKINHDKLCRFLKITKKYLSSGLSSIIKYHGSNIILNYCYICPCKKCRINMMLLLSEFNFKRRGLYQLVNLMIDILNSCVVKSQYNKISDQPKMDIKIDSNSISKELKKKPEIIIKDLANKIDKNLAEKKSNNKSEIKKIDTKKIDIKKIDTKKIDIKKVDTKKIDIKKEKKIIEGKQGESNESKIFDLNSFTVNQNAYKIMVGNRLKIISKQIGSTPGVKVSIPVKPGQKYKFTPDVEYGEDMNIILWIKELKFGRVITFSDLDNIEYNNKFAKSIDVGLSIKSAKYNDIFYVNKFEMMETF